MAEEFSTSLATAHADALASFEFHIEQILDFLNARPDLPSAQQAELFAAESLIEELKVLVDQLCHLKETLLFMKDNPSVANMVALELQAFERRLIHWQIQRSRAMELEVIARDLKEKLKEYYKKLSSIAMAVNMVTTIGIVASAVWSYFHLSKQR